VAEGEAMNMWSERLDVTIRMSQISKSEDPPRPIVPETLIALADRLVKGILPELVERRELWKARRLENWRREGDVPKQKVHR
jgi:hypothetical protein